VIQEIPGLVRFEPDPREEPSAPGEVEGQVNAAYPRTNVAVRLWKMVAGDGVNVAKPRPQGQGMFNTLCLSFKSTLSLQAPVTPSSGHRPDRSKYGNRVLRAYLQNNRKVWAESERGRGGGRAEFSESVLAADHRARCRSSHRRTSRGVIDEAIGQGIGHLCMQPGAEDDEASNAPATWE